MEKGVIYSMSLCFSLCTQYTFMIYSCSWFTYEYASKISIGINK